MQRVLWLLGWSLFTTFAHVGTTRAEDGMVRASIVSILPQGSKSVVIVNRGLRFGIRVGQVGRCTGPRKFDCKVTEVYEFRTRCIADIDSRHIEARACDFEAPRRRAISVRVLEVIPEGESTTLVVDKGHRAGVGLSDWVEVDGHRCRLWRIENDRAACSVDEDLPPQALGKATLVSYLFVPSGSLAAPLIAPPPTLEHQSPKRGVLQSAMPVMLARAPTHGLVAASPCVGFTPDERAVYVLRPGSIGVPPFIDERWLELVHIDFATGGGSIVATFSPAMVATSQAQLAELVVRERLLACHAAETTTRSSVGDKGLMAHHRRDRILFWSSDEIIYAAMEGGAGLAERVGRGALEKVWFVPGFAVHLGQVGHDLQVLEVR